MDSRRKLQKIWLVSLIAAASGLWCMPKGYSESEEDLQKLEQRIFQKVNAARSEQQACMLDWNEEAAAEARRHAQNMADRNFFAHEDPKRGELSRRLDISGIVWNRCAENIYREFGFINPDEDAIQSWLKSPGHRSNMLDPGFAETGIGAATAGNGTIYVVQIFIKKFIANKAKSSISKKL